MTYYEHWLSLKEGRWNTEESTDTQFKVEYDSLQKILYVSFQAAHSKKDWLILFHFWKKHFPKKHFLRKIHSVHYGIYKKYLSVKSYLFDCIDLYKPKKLIIRGYSKGASIGLLFTADLSINKKDQEKETIVFAPLRIFSWFTPKNLFLNTINIKNRGDVVTHLPPFIFGYKQVGKRFYLSKKRFPLPKYHDDDLYEKELRDLYEKNKMV